LAFACTFVSVQAQQTWIVNPSGGHFTSLGPAIAGASAGDTLLLTSGAYYSGAYYLDKALHIIGDPVQRPKIRYLAHTSAAVGTLASFRHLDVEVIEVWLPSLLEDVNCTVGTLFATTSLIDCEFGGDNQVMGDALRIAGGDVAMHGCTIRGNGVYHTQTLWCVVMAGQTLVVDSARVAISDSTIRGTDSVYVSCATGPSVWSMASPGVLALNNASVRITRSTVSGGVGAWGVLTNAFTHYPNSGSSWLVRDPSVGVTPASNVGVVASYPGTDASSALPGNTILCRALSGPGLPAVLVAGLGLHAPVQTPYGEAWLDPAAYVILRIGFTDAMGVLAASIVLPASAPSSLPITVQSLAVPGVSGNLVAGAPVVVQVL